MSEPAEVQTMLETVHQAMKEGKVEAQVSWLLDSGFDDVAVWRTIWEQEEHVVCRVCQRTRLVQWPTETGTWSKGPLEEAAKRLKTLAMVCTKMEVPIGKQEHLKQQAVGVEVSACSCAAQLSQRGAPLWLGARSDPVQRSLARAGAHPQLLLGAMVADHRLASGNRSRGHAPLWDVSPEMGSGGELQVYEDVPGLGGRASARLAGDQTLVALAWVAAGFLYEMAN